MPGCNFSINFIQYIFICTLDYVCVLNLHISISGVFLFFHPYAFARMQRFFILQKGRTLKPRLLSFVKKTAREEAVFRFHACKAYWFLGVADGIPPIVSISDRCL